MANINQVSPDGGTTIYDLEDTTARNGIDAITDGQSIESFSDVETALETKADTSSLGTAATKNSTSVVTQSSDLVESGAVYNAIQAQEQLLEDTVGWTGKNLMPLDVYHLNSASGNLGQSTFVSNNSHVSFIAPIKQNTDYIIKNVGGNGFRVILSSAFPAVGNACEVVFASTEVHEHTFNSGNYNYVTFYCSYNNQSVDVIQPQLYHASVDTQKADNSVIAPVENGTNASQAWSVGQHFMNGGVLKEVTNAIGNGEPISGSNTSNTTVAKELEKLLPIFNNAGFHNSIFRGKNLGSSLTAAQKTAIAAGTFEDMYIGDYWEINGIKWRIAHFDYWLNIGDTGGVGVCSAHHVIIVPDSALLNGNMHDKVDNQDTTVGAYVNSNMKTTHLPSAITIIESAFGASNILEHRSYLQNAVSNGYESGGAWTDTKVDLMNEKQVYGSDIYHNILNSTSVPNNYTVDKTQFALFRLDQSYIVCRNVAQTDRASWWLRDVVSSAGFAYVLGSGYCGYNNASNSYGVRPAFGIKGN